VLFAGAAKGINEIAFEDNSKSFFVMKFDFDDNQKFSCLEINTVNSNDILNRLKSSEKRFDDTNNSDILEEDERHL